MISDPVLLTAAASALASCFMGGLIWFVQVVHYPLFADVSREAFPHYERSHQARTTIVVAPVMLLEAATALVLATPVLAADRYDWTLALVGAALVVAVWLSTFGVQVPLHTRLATGLNPRIVRRLVRTNWVRTALWSARAVVSLVILVQAAAPQA